MDILGNKKHEEEDDEILVCARTDGMPPIYGSLRGTCFECDGAVWVSVSGQKALKKSSELKVCCMECAFERMKDDDDIKASIVPGAIEELKRHFLKIEEN